MAFISMYQTYVFILVIRMCMFFYVIWGARHSAENHFAEIHFAEKTLCRNDTLPKIVFGCDTLQNFLIQEILVSPI